MTSEDGKSSIFTVPGVTNLVEWRKYVLPPPPDRALTSASAFAMPLKLTCPQCSAAISLNEPYPLPGAAVQCPSCGAGIAVSYPAGAMDALLQRGKRFADPDARPAAAIPPVPRAPMPAPPPKPATPVPPPPAPTEIDATRVEATEHFSTNAPPSFSEFDRTVPSMRTPYGGLPNNAHEPESTTPQNVASSPAAETEHPGDTLGGAPTRKQHPQVGRTPDSDTSPPPKKKKGLLWKMFGGMAGTLLMGAGLVGVTGALVAGGGYYHYSQDLPTIETLQGYEPATVTVVYDKNGELLGEIYEQRRYVVPLETIPEHVQNAFIAAEDANFWNHGGVDYMGILRAMGRNLAKGRMAQGASTITQQVTRNFLLTKDKKLERKIKEIILSWRIEDTYSKEHILYLYLNEIYLGSQAYGVEAASRTYFGKGVADISIAEAAILAGLPQRPSDYSPHKHFQKAKARQGYVIDQMLRNGYISEAEATEARAEQITVIPRGNAFREQAPYFTEHVRRYVVDKYGKDRVLNEGLQITTTCDLSLQKTAQKAVQNGVYQVDQRMGFRRDGIEHLDSDAAIEDRRKTAEETLRKQWAYNEDPAGRVPVPEQSVLTEGAFYDGILLEVTPKWARVAIGAHEGIIPLEWASWAYQPNTYRSWRSRKQTDLTEKIDTDGDRKRDASILQRGDVVRVKLEQLSSRGNKAFKRTPGAEEDLLAVRLWQEPQVEAALMSFDVQSGAVRSMIGGSNFQKTEFNRATQGYRQVGSTFKPIVYSAAINARKVTSASMVTDAPLAFATNNDFVWKPTNYGHEYEGQLTLRQALAGSKNTCTVRVLESMDPGMNDDVVYEYARRLGIGGPPTHTLPDDWVPTRENDHLCPWIREEKDFEICMDRFPPKDPEISNTKHRMLMGPDDEYWCRACDMSMGLGSASLTMQELLRAYSAFATDGYLVEPYFIEEVRDRNGTVLEQHEDVDFKQVLDPEVASVTRWLLESVASTGTGYPAKKALGLRGLAGKTGTTNDHKDTWFVGFTNDVITAAWVGFDQPRSLGVASTGGRTALPIWIDYMREAAPKDRDRAFPMHEDIEWAWIDQETGRRVKSGGIRYPFISGTLPESTGINAGQLTLSDLSTEL